MEDRTKSKDQPADNDENKVIELTPDMEVSAQTSGKIIDLTDALESIDDQPPLEPPSEERISSEDETRSQTPDTIPTATSAPTPAEEATSAFNADQSAEPVDTPVEPTSDKLFDHLSELTERVDQAAGQAVDPQIIEDPTSAEEITAPDLNPEEPQTAAEKTAMLTSDKPGLDENSLAKDAADIEAIMAIEPEEDPSAEEAAPSLEDDILLEDELTLIDEPGLGESDLSEETAEIEAAMAMETEPDDEEIIELTDIVDPAELKATEPDQAIDDEELIELTDIIDPAELKAAGLEEDETDEGIIELTDIVDPAELKATASAQVQDDEEILELADIVDSTEPAAAEPTQVQDEEPILELDSIVEPETLEATLEESADLAMDQATEEMAEPSEMVTQDEISEPMQDLVEPSLELSDQTEQDLLESDHTPEEAEKEKDLGFPELTDLFADEAEPVAPTSEEDEISEPMQDSAEPSLELSDQTEQDLLEPEPDFTPVEAKEEEKDSGFPELTGLFADKAEPTIPESEEMETAPIAPVEAPTEEDDQVIQLSDVLNSAAKELPLESEEIAFGTELEPEAEQTRPEDEETSDTMGLDIADTTASTPEAPQTLSEQDIDEAIERIIHTKYADTIEKMIASAVEKAVTREIENIKRALMDGDEPLL